MAFQNLCPPALIYLLFSITQVVIDTVKGLYNTAMIKIWVAFVFTILLNYLCDLGLGIISWLIVFIPFIMITGNSTSFTSFQYLTEAPKKGTILSVLIISFKDVYTHTTSFSFKGMNILHQEDSETTNKITNDGFCTGIFGNYILKTSKFHHTPFKFLIL